MSGGMPPWTLLELLGTTLEGMDSLNFQQLSSDVWHESQRPFSPLAESDPLAHLAFTVVAGIWIPLGAQVPGQLNMDRLPISVLFSYHLRPDQQREDYRAAFRAADQVCKTLGDSEAWALGAVEVEIREKARVGLVSEQPYALVECAFNLTFNPGD